MLLQLKMVQLLSWLILHPLLVLHPLLGPIGQVPILIYLSSFASPTSILTCFASSTSFANPTPILVYLTSYTN